MDFATVEGGVELQHDININNLQPVLMDSLRALEHDSPLIDCKTDKLSSKIGQLLWVARQNRPDFMFDTCILASILKHGAMQIMHKANKVVKKVRTCHPKILEIDDSLKLVVFSDAFMGNLPDGGTQGGHIVLMGKEGIFSAVCWQSKRIKRVAWSTLDKHLLLLMGMTMPYFCLPSTLNSPQEMSHRASCR